MLAAVPSWQAPALTREGQKRFWDQQAAGYDDASLTNNASELALVETLCSLFCESGFVADDVVALGCGTGSRDPRAILATLEGYGQLVPTTYMNDISSAMLEEASHVISPLASPIARGEIILKPGAACDALREVPRRPRRVILGVYRVDAFARAFPHYGHPLSGFDDYLSNAKRLGPYFQITDVHLQGKDERFMGEIRLTADGDEAHYDLMRAVVQGLPMLPALSLTRVTGWKEHGDDSFFLSHWFTESGIRQLLRTSLGGEVETRLSLVACAKSFVICIDPPEAPEGIVTMLNNAFGNLIPEDWEPTLSALNEACCLS